MISDKTTKIAPEKQEADLPGTSASADSKLYGNGINAEPARENSPKITRTISGIDQINGKQNS